MIDNHLIENRHIRVFISSTFQDMQGERDYLMKHTFPTLRKLASERDVTLTEIDLRWGITEEESQSGKVVEICLREIENSVPFFIGIIGNRYGWVPKEQELGEKVTERYPAIKDYVNRQLSVTEMEMQFGVLERKEDMNAYFYIKEEEKGKEIDNPKMLERLKKAVSDSRYPSSSYSTVDDLAQQVEQAFTTLLDKLFPVGNISELEKERIGQRSIMRQLCQNYVRDERNFQALDEWVKDWDSHQMVVTGASGMGKSALIAYWMNEKLNDENRDYNIIYHFTGNGGSECSHEHIKTALSNEIEDIYGWNDIGEDTISQINNTEGGLKEDKKDKLDQLFLRVASEGDKPLLIVLDAVNQIVDNDNAKLLNWLPIPPRKVKILFSTLEDDRTMQVFKNRNYPIFTLQPLEVDNRKRLIEGYLGQFAKKLTTGNVERIAGDKQCENTMVLKTLLDELINYGIYEKIGERIEYYLSQETIEDFYQALLQSYEEEFGKDFVAHALSLIAVSKNGLSEDEMLAILNHGCDEDNPRVPRLYWSQFLCAFMSHTTTKGGNITFSHSYILNAVEERYLKSDHNNERTCREEIVKLMDGQETDRAFAEKAWQLFNLKDHKRLHDFLLNIRVFDSLYTSDEYALGQYWRELIANGYKLADYKPLLKDADKDSCDNVSVFCSNIMADCDTAEFASLQSIEKARELYGEESEKTSTSYQIIGIVYSYKGDNDKALEYQLKALEIREKVLGTEHPNTAASYNNIGIMYDCLDDYDKALEYCNKAIKISLKELGEAHPETARSYLAIGYVYSDKGDYDKALEYNLKALEILVKVFGVEHPNTARFYNNIGSAYSDKCDYDKALEFSQKALEFSEKVLGGEHPDTAGSYYNIGNVYSDLGDYSKALEYHLKALEIREKVLGWKHLDTATSYGSIGNVYSDKYDYDKALEYYLRALEIRENVLGTEHPDTAGSYYNIGIVYKAKGDYDKALEYCHKALEIRENVLGIAHPDTIHSYNNIGIIYKAKGDYDKVLEYYQKVLEIRENVLGTNHSDTARSYNNIGTVYYQQGDYDKALDYHLKALEIREKVLGTERPDTAGSYNSVAWFYHLLNRYEDALPYIEQAIKVSPDNFYYVDTLGTVYQGLGRYDEAMEQFELCLKLKKEQGASEESIHKTEEKIGELKALMKR